MLKIVQKIIRPFCHHTNETMYEWEQFAFTPYKVPGTVVWQCNLCKRVLIREDLRKYVE